jgi:hypothetical protein
MKNTQDNDMSGVVRPLGEHILNIALSRPGD